MTPDELKQLHEQLTTHQILQERHRDEVNLQARSLSRWVSDAVADGRITARVGAEQLQYFLDRFNGAWETWADQAAKVEELLRAYNGARDELAGRISIRG